eukprot:SM000099S25194  [mRNA]  locus=s99:83029:88120:- [translate_table: standard]
MNPHIPALERAWARIVSILTSRSLVANTDSLGHPHNGSIPASIGNLTGLTCLYLYGNRLLGNIPPTVGALTQLVLLNLDHNFLSGSIPSSIGQLSVLELLQVAHNQLTGPIIVPEVYSSNIVLEIVDLSYNNFTGTFPVNLLDYTKSNLRVLNIAGNQFGGALPDLNLIAKPFSNLGKLRKLDISRNKFQGVFSLSFFSSTQNLTWLDITDNYFSGPAPNNVTKEGIPVHTSLNCFSRPTKWQRPASVCAALPAPSCSVDNYGLSCQNWQPGLLGQDLASIQHVCVYADCNSTTLRCTRANFGDGSYCASVAGVDSSCASFSCRNGSCAVMSYYPAGSSCYLFPDYINLQCELQGACDGVGHCKYDYAATANTTCNYIPGNDFCSVQKCRNGTCAQLSPLPDGTNCAKAFDIMGYGPGPFAEYKGCATALCMNGKCTLNFLSDGTPCNITGLNTTSYPDCVSGKCSEGICQTDSYKPVDTPCGGPCPYGCCAFCDDQGTCLFDNAGSCYYDGHSGQCLGTRCIFDGGD